MKSEIPNSYFFEQSKTSVETSFEQETIYSETQNITIMNIQNLKLLAFFS